MNDLSFLTILSLISFPVPGIAQMIQGVMLSFIYLDILMTDQWLVPLIYGDQSADDDDHALNQQFADNGFGSMTLIKNLQSTFVYLVILVFTYFLLAFSKLFA